MDKGLKRSFITTLLIALFCLAPVVVKAQGDLLVTPLRLVFDGKKRVIDVTLANTGNDTSRYNISFLNYRMTEDGSMEEITEPDEGQNFADKILRYFPRSVTLAPGEAQVIKVQAGNISRLKEGEYRSHLYFRAAVGGPAIALGEEESEEEEEGLTIQLIPIYGISIPAIIRAGTNNSTADIQEISIVKEEESNALNLHFSLIREGNMSVHGDIRALHIATDGTETLVAAVNGVAVYTPGTVRKVILPMYDSEQIDLTSGNLRLTYQAQSQVRPQKYAEVEVELTK